MSQAQILNKIKDRFDDCLIAAYGDIATGVPLLTAGSSNIPIQALSEMCTEAGLTLGTPDAPMFGPDLVRLSVKAQRSVMYCFARAADSDAEAYFFMCTMNVNVPRFVDSVRCEILQETNQ
ncbi:MAG: hypothetical protein AB8B71_02175 [Paracoccaceae bacterium]